MMIKIMARENMEEWKTNPSILDETVKASKRFLESNPEELKNLRDVDGNGGVCGHTPVGHRILAKFIGVTENKVQLSLERLKLANEGIIDLKAVQLAQSNKSATIMAKLFVEVELPVKKQMAAVEAIKESKNYSETNIRKVAIDAKFNMLNKKPIEWPEVKPEYKDKKKITFDNFMAKTWGHAESLNNALTDLIQLKNELEGDDLIVDESLHKGFNMSLDALIEKINNLRTPYQNAIQVNFNPNNRRLIN
jgi:hypothetical protein